MENIGTKNVNIVYLMGAGRSGTTALATFLGNSKSIITLGEMHQFHEHLAKGLPCAHGEDLTTCEFWKAPLSKMNPIHIKESKILDNSDHQVQHHKNVLPLLLGVDNKKKTAAFLKLQEDIFLSLQNEYSPTYFLDSAKYVGRALALRKSKLLNLKIIYVVRDVRGVVWSFKKQVQTSNGPLRTIGYYWIINILAQLAYFRISKKNIIKVRYEDIAQQPELFFEKLEKFLSIDFQDIKGKIVNKGEFNMPHIVGGNRLKANKTITYRKDDEWQRLMPTFKKRLYYLLTLPLMLINNYPIKE